MQKKNLPNFGHPKSPKETPPKWPQNHHLLADFQEAARFQGWSLKTQNSTGFSGSFFWGKANNKSREKKKGGRYIDDLHPPNKLLFG